MKNAKRIAVTLLVSAVVCGTFAKAQTAKPAKPVDWRARAKEAIKESMYKYVHYYKPGNEQKAKLEKVLIAQYKDLLDFDKTRGPKIKEIDEKIAGVNKKIDELKKEIAALEKQKAVHANERAELRIDHKAEINNVFSEQQRLDYLTDYIRRYSAYHHWAGIPKDVQDQLTEQFQAAAKRVIDADPAKSDEVLKTEYRKMREVVKKTITPEHRKAGEVQYLMGSTMRKFNRLKLTESQLAQVRELCEKAAKRKAELYTRYRQIDKDRAAIRSSLSQFSSSSYYYKIREQVVESVLTDQQRKQGGFKRKASSKRS